MKPAGLVVALCGALLLSSVAAASESDCRLVQLASLDLKPKRKNFLAPVSVNGHEIQLLVDTGGLYSMITASLANRLGLQRQTLPADNQIQDAFGGRINEYVVADTIRFGHLTGKTWRFLVLPDDLADGLDGLLAPDLLHLFDVEFDFAHRQMNLFSSERCPGKAVYWTEEAFGAVPMTLNEFAQIQIKLALDGRKIESLIDTGALTSAMNLDQARRLFDWATDPPELRSHLDRINGNSITLYNYPFKSLSFEGVQISRPSIDLSNEFQPRNAPLIVGMNVLSKLHLYIAYKEQMLYVTHERATHVSSIAPAIPQPSFASPSEMKWPGEAGPH